MAVTRQCAIMRLLKLEESAALDYVFDNTQWVPLHARALRDKLAALRGESFTCIPSMYPTTETLTAYVALRRWYEDGDASDPVPQVEAMIRTEMVFGTPFDYYTESITELAASVYGRRTTR